MAIFKLKIFCNAITLKITLFVEERSHMSSLVNFMTSNVDFVQQDDKM